MLMAPVRLAGALLVRHSTTDVADMERLRVRTASLLGEPHASLPAAARANSQAPSTPRPPLLRQVGLHNILSPLASEQH